MLGASGTRIFGPFWVSGSRSLVVALRDVPFSWSNLVGASISGGGAVDWAAYLRGVLESGAFVLREDQVTGEEYVSAEDCTVIIVDDYNTFYNNNQIGWNDKRTKSAYGDDDTPEGAYKVLCGLMRKFCGAVYLSSGGPTGWGFD